jgi:hypothetical protein
MAAPVAADQNSPAHRRFIGLMDGAFAPDEPATVGMPREIALAGFPARHRERMRNVQELRESFETVLMGELFSIVHGSDRSLRLHVVDCIFRAVNSRHIRAHDNCLTQHHSGQYKTRRSAATWFLLQQIKRCSVCEAISAKKSLLGY